MLKLVVLAVRNEVAQICQDLLLNGLEVVWDRVLFEVERGDECFEVLGSRWAVESLLDILDQG